MIKRFATFAFAALAAASASAQTNVGVSIGIHQPGVYGRIDIGNAGPPPVVYAQPMVIAPSRVANYQQPVYLYVPAPQQANWGRYCGRYAACGQPVYFVQERWVSERYEEHRGDRGNRSRGPQGKNEKHKDKGHGRD
jgi:hypothetical protein